MAGSTLGLEWSGKTETNARAAYRKVVEKGVDSGSQPGLVGGGLIRSMRGWSHVLSLRKSGLKEKFDERILGSGEYVESLMCESDEKVSRQFVQTPSQSEDDDIIFAVSVKEGVTVKELKGGSRRAVVSMVRIKLTFEVIEQYGLTPAEVARQLGVTISAISKMISRVHRMNDS